MPLASTVRSLVADRVFTLPPHRLIAWARLTLAGFGVGALTLDPLASAQSPEFIVSVLYLFFAAARLLVAAARPPGRRERVLTHAVDILTVSLLMYLTDGPTSSFFVFFTFILLSATLLWHGSGALVTAVLLALSFAVLVLLGEQQDPDELRRSIIRSGYLLVAGAMLGYVGSFQERSRARVTKLAAWPGPDGDESPSVPIHSALAHAAEILRAPRALLIWEEAQEPFRHVALWSGEELSYSREAPDRFGTIVAPALAGSAFEVEDAGPASLDQNLKETFAIRQALSAPFTMAGCRGRVFLLDREVTSHDDLVLAELAAMRLGVDLEHHLLRHELRSAAASEERARLAHDLHDGVLQGLAAANIQLRLTARQASGALDDQLARTRELIASEQQRIRSFVEESRSSPAMRTTQALLHERLSERLEGVAAQWGCEIRHAVVPSDLRVAEGTAHHVRHMVVEAVSNAVRHGGAALVEIGVEARNGRLVITVRDDGCGFAGLEGHYSAAELEHRGLAPASLVDRTRRLGGGFTVESSSTGSEVRLEVPYG